MSLAKDDAYWADLFGWCTASALAGEVSPAAAHFNALLQIAWEATHNPA